MPTSKVSKKYLTSIPAEVRRRLGIEESDILIWEFDASDEYVIVRVAKNPLKVLRGKYSRRDIVYDRVEETADTLIQGEVHADN